MLQKMNKKANGQWVCDGIPKDGREYPNSSGAHNPVYTFELKCPVCGLPKEALSTKVGKLSSNKLNAIGLTIFISLALTSLALIPVLRNSIGKSTEQSPKSGSNFIGKISNTVELFSSSIQEGLQLELRYAQLKQSLQSGKLFTANQQTFDLVLMIEGEEALDNDFLDPMKWENFPCPHWQRIDNMWDSNTDGRQGFSAQWDVYQSISENNQDIQKEYNDITDRLTFNFIDPPKGHLPSLHWGGCKDGKCGDYSQFITHKCEEGKES